MNLAAPETAWAFLALNSTTRPGRRVPSSLQRANSPGRQSPPRRRPGHLFRVTISFFDLVAFGVPHDEVLGNYAGVVDVYEGTLLARCTRPTASLSIFRASAVRRPGVAVCVFGGSLR